MAKGKRAAAVTESAPAPKMAVTVQDHDPSQVKSKEVRETHTDTEEALVAGQSASEAHNDYIGKRWAERQLRDGKKKWYNPMASRDARVMHDTEEGCLAEIRTQYKMQAKAAKLTGKPYQPVMVIESPKRTLADFMGPKHMQMAQASLETRMEIQNLGRMAETTGGRTITAGVLMAMPESMAKAKVPVLSDTELVRLAYKSQFGGKKFLYKAVAIEISKRNAKLPADGQILLAV